MAEQVLPLKIKVTPFDKLRVNVVKCRDRSLDLSFNQLADRPEGLSLRDPFIWRIFPLGHCKNKDRVIKYQTALKLSTRSR